MNLDSNTPRFAPVRPEALEMNEAEKRFLAAEEAQRTPSACTCISSSFPTAAWPFSRRCRNTRVITAACTGA